MADYSEREEWGVSEETLNPSLLNCRGLSQGEPPVQIHALLAREGRPDRTVTVKAPAIGQPVRLFAGSV
jgi:hypothetical protein